jgi:CheY-like chemotaxis protein
MSSKKIFIIDDDVDLIEAAQIILEANNFEVITSTTVHGIPDRVIKEKPDLILLDVMFPESPTAGFELCRVLKGDAQTQMIPIIMLSAINQKFNMAFTSAIRDKKQNPAEHFIEKPIDPTSLINLIKKTLKS